MPGASQLASEKPRTGEGGLLSPEDGYRTFLEVKTRGPNRAGDGGRDDLSWLHVR